MHMYTAVGICVVFVCLMTVVIVNETISVVEVLSTLVSSVDVISLNAPHRDSVIGLKGTYLNKTVFNVSDFCNCSMRNDLNESTPCDSFTITYPGEESQKNILLLTAGPRKWNIKEATVFECQHDFIPLITYLVVPQSYADLSRQVTRDKMNGEFKDATEYVDKIVFHSPMPWVNANTRNQVLLSREDHYSDDVLENSYIKTIISQAADQKNDYTEARFLWREGRVTKINKFKNGSLWSLAALMCTVLLGIERCVAFVNRAKNKTPQQKDSRSGNQVAPLPSRPVSAEESNDTSKTQTRKGTPFWGGFRER